MSIKFADIPEERRVSVMRCERSVITIIFFRLGYLVHNLGKCAITLPTETGLSACVKGQMNAEVPILETVA